MSLGRVAGAIFLSGYVALLFFWNSDPLFYLHLALHEAGHIFAIPFGQVVHVAGGSLLQWAVPLVFLAYFAFKRNWFAVATMVIWFGASLRNSVPYIADAKAKQLPLLAENLIHDWNFLLIQFNLLSHTETIAAAVNTTAWTMLLLRLAACWALALMAAGEGFGR